MVEKSKTKKLSMNKNLFFFFDTETTGFPKTKRYQYNQYYPYTELDKYDSSRIVQITWAIYNYNEDQKIMRTFYVKPDGFTIDNSEIHGITTDMATKKGVPIKEVFDALKKDLKNVKFLVAHNLCFDLNVLCSELCRYGYTNLASSLQKKKHVCTGEKTKNILKLPLNSAYNIDKYKMPKLNELYEYCFGKELEGHHDAENDTNALAKCFFHLIKS
jgi:DNA polymerase-3 subunit alpha